jgi:hypothetical protein
MGHLNETFLGSAGCRALLPSDPKTSRWQELATIPDYSRFLKPLQEAEMNVNAVIDSCQPQSIRNLEGLQHSKELATGPVWVGCPDHSIVFDESPGFLSVDPA